MLFSKMLENISTFYYPLVAYPRVGYRGDGMYTQGASACVYPGYAQYTSAAVAAAGGATGHQIASTNDKSNS